MAVDLAKPPADPKRARVPAAVAKAKAAQAAAAAAPEAPEVRPKKKRGFLAELDAAVFGEDDEDEEEDDEEPPEGDDEYVDWDYERRRAVGARCAELEALLARATAQR